MNQPVPKPRPATKPARAWNSTLPARTARLVAKAQIARTPFRSRVPHSVPTGSPRSALSVSKPMRARSKKTAEQMKLYVPEMLAFLADHDRCEFPGCRQPSTVLHHRKGRNGRRLRDQRFWSAACDPHNEFAETHTGESLAIGWLLRINSKDAA